VKLLVAVKPLLSHLHPLGLIFSFIKVVSVTL